MPLMWVQIASAVRVVNGRDFNASAHVCLLKLNLIHLLNPVLAQFSVVGL